MDFFFAGKIQKDDVYIMHIHHKGVFCSGNQTRDPALFLS